MDGVTVPRFPTSAGCVAGGYFIFLRSDVIAWDLRQSRYEAGVLPSLEKGRVSEIGRWNLPVSWKL